MRTWVAMLLLGIAAPLPAAGRAQEAPPSPYVVANIFTIQSKILGEARRITVYNPDDVGGNLLTAYPVLYLLEENDLPMVAGTVKYLSSYNEQLPAMLVVGIDAGSDRIRDMTPTSSRYDNMGKLDADPDSWLASSGGGDKFLRFVREELMPYIDSHYRTARFRILAGHSVGGLLSLHALTAHPNMFDAHIAVSPSLWWDRGGLLPEMERRLQAPATRRAFLYLADSPESGPFNTYVDRFLSILAATKPPRLRFKHAHYPDETHGSIAASAYYDGLRFLFPDWNIAESDDSAGKIVAHYRRMSERLGYPIQPPLGMTSGWANNFLRAGKLDEAVALLELNAHNFPAFAFVHAELGEALARKGDRQGAVSAFRKALGLAPGDARVAARLKALESQAPPPS